MLKQYREEFKIGVRIACLVFFISFGMVVLLAGIKQAMAADLKAETIITDDYIRLGDIFDGVKNADYVLGPAPQPGKDMILNARTLYKIASALDVDWKPRYTTEQTVLRREAVILSQEEISKALEVKIVESGVEDKFNITFTNTIKDIVLPANADETMDVTAFTFNSQSDSFDAVIVAPSKEDPQKRINISGRIERLVPVPVLKSGLKNGDIISAHDIDFVEMPKNRIPSGIITQEQDLLNMTPRRVISGGKLVMQNDIEKPKMVDRGDSITLVFANGPLLLTAKGKSLQAGAMGDTVRVSNLDSNKNLQGVVTADREVTIR